MKKLFPILTLFALVSITQMTMAQKYNVSKNDGMSLDTIDKFWKGKNVWTNRAFIENASDPNSEINMPMRIMSEMPVKLCSPVLILNIKFIKAEDIDTLIYPKGYVCITLQYKNKLNKIDTGTFSFSQDKYSIEELFYLTDPHKEYKWSKKVWDAIENEKIFIGMTAAQATMSWGEPDHVNEDAYSEQWVYEDGDYLYFRHGVLTNYQIEH